MVSHLSAGAHRLRGKLRQAVSDAHGRRRWSDFRAFHCGLADRRAVVYTFFTGNLLHWLDRAVSFVPPEVNLVLLGSDLTAEERAWVERLGRPFHCFAERLDDNAVLDLVFAVSDDDFAWLHIDCFVLNPGLFAEMFRFEPETVLNCIWFHPGPAPTLHSAFVAVHHEVLAAIRRRGLDVWPSTYHYEGAATGRTVTQRPLYSRVPTARQERLLATVLPAAGAAGGRPAYPVGDCFEILEVYQLVANALGYRLHQVRRLVRDGTVSAQHYSDEILHVNGVSTYRRYQDAGPGKSYIDRQEYLMLLQADFAMLLAFDGEIPGSYREMRRQLAQETAALGLSAQAVVQNLTGFLLQRGVSAESCARILRAA